jgi:hypothetical protein
MFVDCLWCYQFGTTGELAGSGYCAKWSSECSDSIAREPSQCWDPDVPPPRGPYDGACGDVSCGAPYDGPCGAGESYSLTFVSGAARGNYAYVLCSGCVAGKYQSSAEHRAACRDCDEGKFASSPNAEVCEQGPSGHTSASGSDDASDCFQDGPPPPSPWDGITSVARSSVSPSECQQAGCSYACSGTYTVSLSGNTMVLTPANSNVGSCTCFTGTLTTSGSSASGAFEDGVAVTAERSGSTISVAAGDENGNCTGTYSATGTGQGEIVLATKSSGSATTTGTVGMMALVLCASAFL